MFDALTIDELIELTNRLCDAQSYWRHHSALCARMADEMQAIEHTAWHARCVKSGIRCVHCQPDDSLNHWLDGIFAL